MASESRTLKVRFSTKPHFHHFGTWRILHVFSTFAQISPRLRELADVEISPRFLHVFLNVEIFYMYETLRIQRISGFIASIKHLIVLAENKCFHLSVENGSFICWKWFICLWKMVHLSVEMVHLFQTINSWQAQLNALWMLCW